MIIHVQEHTWGKAVYYEESDWAICMPGLSTRVLDRYSFFIEPLVLLNKPSLKTDTVFASTEKGKLIQVYTHHYIK